MTTEHGYNICDAQTASPDMTLAVERNIITHL